MCECFSFLILCSQIAARTRVNRAESRRLRCFLSSSTVCMIKPDRPPYCSFMTIGVFWVRPCPFSLVLERRRAYDLALILFALAEILASRWSSLHLRANPSRGSRSTQNLRFQGTPRHLPHLFYSRWERLEEKAKN